MEEREDIEMQRQNDIEMQRQNDIEMQRQNDIEIPLHNDQCEQNDQNDQSDQNKGGIYVPKKRRRRRRTVVYRVPREIELQNAIAIEREKSNHYSSTKSVGQGLLDLSIIVGHVQTLVSLFSQGTPLTGLQITLIVLIGIVLGLQLLLAFLVGLLYKTSGEQVTKNLTATGVNFFVTFLTMVSLACNASIAIIAGQMKLTH